MGVTVTIGKDSDGNYYATVDDESTTSTYTTTDYDLVANKTTTISSYTFSNSVTNAYISDKKHYYNTSSTIEQSDSISNVNNISTISYYYNDLEYVFKLLVHFINMLLFSGIPLQPIFQSVVVNYLRKIKNISLVSIFFQYHSLPDNFELAKYLVDECQVLNKEIEDENELKNTEEFRKNTFQYGLDMLIRLKKFDEAFMVMINKGMFAEALLFLKRYNVQINFLSEETVKRLTILIKENKNLVCEYLMY